MIGQQGFIVSVMEVACGEHGECVHKLVMAVNNGKCNNYQHHQAAIAAAQTVSNDIAKESPQEQTKSEGTALIPNGVAKPPTGATMINMPVSCTTSLLDSAESIEQKVGFPRSGWVQFWILLKRTFLSQMRDMVSDTEATLKAVWRFFLLLELELEST